jgi:hypothetical protein
MNRKFLFCILLLVSFFIGWSSLFCQTSLAPAIWKGNGKDDGSVHALGNGKMLVYEEGINIFWIGSSPYSTPSVFSMFPESDQHIVTQSVREQGTAVWIHHLYQNEKLLGSAVDFVDSELPCMIRQFNLTAPLIFRLTLKDEAIVIEKSQLIDAKGENGKLLLLIPSGTQFFEKYAYPGAIFHQIAWKGNAKIEPTGEKKNEYFVRLEPGLSELYFIGGSEYPQIINNWEEIRNLTYKNLLNRTRKWWNDFTARRTDFYHQLPSDLPQRQQLLQLIDDVSVMIRTQQSESGAVMSGYRYPIAYVRDQYGVSRGLIALGYLKEAKHIMEFYWSIWKQFGEIHNAQAIGIQGVFHYAENDDVEITGYLILQAFDLYEKSGDDDFLMTIFPMLEWCWESQKKHLADGMLPFNGDETYVAGGFLPRSSLNDGSFEATLLFIEGGEKFLSWIGKHNLWTSGKLEIEGNVLKATGNSFRQNFWRNGQLITNNPERVDFAKLPQFRHGPCERRGPDCLVINNKGFRSGALWSERDQNNRYQCPACLISGPLPKVKPFTYHLISSNLTALYIHSALLKPEEVKPMVEKVYGEWEKTGILSSVTDSTGINKNRGTVGYDYGYLLYAMLETGMENTGKIYRQTISVADSAGIWSEYYLENVPYLTRYRPWESAINIEALIRYAKQYKK